MKENKPATLKSTLMDKVIELRYMGRGVTYEAIRKEVATIAEKFDTNEIGNKTLVNNVNGKISRHESNGYPPEKCLNNLMEIL